MTYIVKTYNKRDYKCVNDIKSMLEEGHSLDRIADHENFLIYFFKKSESVVRENIVQPKVTKVNKKMTTKKRKTIEEDSDD